METTVVTMSESGFGLITLIILFGLAALVILYVIVGFFVGFKAKSGHRKSKKKKPTVTYRIEKWK